MTKVLECRHGLKKMKVFTARNATSVLQNSNIYPALLLDLIIIQLYKIIGKVHSLKEHHVLICICDEDDAVPGATFTVFNVLVNFAIFRIDWGLGDIEPVVINYSGLNRLESLIVIILFPTTRASRRVYRETKEKYQG